MDPFMIEELASQNASIRTRLFSGVEGKKRKIFYDQVFKYMKEANHQMSTLAEKQFNQCKIGCNHCCYQIFPITKSEIDLITFYLIENKALFDDFIDKTLAREQILAESPDIHSTCADHSQDGYNEFFKLKIPCAFLNEGRCMIYDIRPINCSSHMSINPPRICAMDPTGYVPASMNALRSKTLQWMMSRAISCFKEDRYFIDVSRSVVENLVSLRDSL